jgi:hypothetical protein
VDENEKMLNVSQNTTFSRNIPGEKNWFDESISVDGQVGIIKNMNTSSPSLEEYKKNLARTGRVKLSKIYDIPDTSVIVEAEFYFDGLSGTSHCVNFTLPRFTHINLNVTMPNQISNYTFGRQEFIENNYTADGNSIIAEIKPYPCCGVKNASIQVVQVCSE